MEKRLYFLDFLKVIAIVFVVFYHSIFYSCDFINGDRIINGIHYFITSFLSICVPLFFFVNGYLLFRKKFDLKKHVQRVILLTVLTFLWGSLLLFIFMFMRNEFLSIPTFMRYLFHFQMDWIHFLWFMGSLICIYLIFPVLKVTFDHHKKVFLYFTVMCFIFTFGNRFLNMIGTILLGKVEMHVSLLSMMNPFIGIHGYTFVYFCLGGICYFYQDKIKKYINFRNKWIALFLFFVSMLCLCFYGVFCSFLSGDIYDIVWNGYDTFFTLMGVMMMYFLSLDFPFYQNKIFIKIVVSISKNTFGIYFLHLIFIEFTKPYLQTIPFLGNVFFQILYVFCIIGVNMFVLSILKKIPIVKRLFIY